MKLRIVFILGIWLIYILHANAQTSPPLSDVADLISSATTYPGSHFAKWTLPPRITLFGKAPDYQQFASEFLTEVAPALNGTGIQPTLLPPYTENPDIAIYVDDKGKLPHWRLKEHAAPNVPFAVTLNPDKSLKHVAVFLEMTYFKGVQPLVARYDIYRMILTGMGFVGDGDNASQILSIWGHSSLNIPEHGMDIIDAKIINFAYTVVPPDATGSDIKQLVFREWARMQLPPAAIAPAAPVAVNPPAPANEEKQLEQFIVAALTTNECGTFRKWLDSPRFSCLYEMTQCRDVVDSFCHEVSDALKGLPIQPTLGPDNDKNANVTVIVLRLQEGDVKAWEAARSRPSYPNDLREKIMKTPGYVSNSPILARQTRLQRYQIQPQQEAHIQNSQFVYLPIGEDTFLKINLFTYGLLSFGLSPVPGSETDSLLSPHSPQNPYKGDPRHLTSFDKKLLRFAYQYVPVGASKDEIRGLIMLHWDKMQMPAAASTPAAPVAPVAVNPPVTASKEGTASTPEIAAWWANKVNSSPNIGFHKWNKPFRISLYGQAVQARSIATKFIEDVRPLLSGVQPILVEDNSPNADAHFIMENKQGLAALKAGPGVDYHVVLNKDQSINHLDTFFDSSVFTGEQPEVIRAQIYQAFLRSLIHVSDDPSPSVVIGETGRYTHGEIDKELISFIYANIPNGASSPAIKEIFHKWNPVAPVPPVANERATFTGSYDALGMTIVNGTQVLNFLSKGVVGKSIRVFSGAGQPIEGYDGGKKCLVVFSPNKKDGTILLTLTYE